MKKMVSLMLVIAMLLSLVACGGTAQQAATSATTSAATSAPAETDPADESTDGFEGIGDVEVDKDIFNVTLNIPADFADEGKTQGDYDAEAKEAGFKSITLNDDGSLTYVMTKSQHKELMARLDEGFHEQLEDLCGSDDYPNFVSVTAKDDFTHFEIVTKSEELDFAESFSVALFFMMSGMYNAFNGTEIDNCNVTYINAESGAVISETNSADLGDADAS